MNQSKKLTYKDAGVDIEAGEALVDALKPVANKTIRPGVMGGIGGFGSLFELSLERYPRPVLVSGTDGVGTKLMLANMLSNHSTIGIDLVAMCVNDVIVSGAEPLFFLDYYATGHLDVDRAKEIVNGIADGCLLAGCSLSGGETAEMPGVYKNNDFDLAGFVVGVVNGNNIIDGSKIKAGDSILGLASSGPHSNGYSLIRKIIEDNDVNLFDNFMGSTIGDQLIEPTRIYVKSILNLLKEVKVYGISHITGGGLTENIPRVLPDKLDANISEYAWIFPPIFSWIQNQGNIDTAEMYRTFNCGIGMVVIVSDQQKHKAIETLEASGEVVYDLGYVTNSTDQSPKVNFY